MGVTGTRALAAAAGAQQARGWAACAGWPPHQGRVQGRVQDRPAPPTCHGSGLAAMSSRLSSLASRGSLLGAECRRGHGEGLAGGN